MPQFGNDEEKAFTYDAFKIGLHLRKRSVSGHAVR